MSKKYVIDLPNDAQYILINGASENHCYTRVEQVDDLEELNSDYINEHYGDLQDEAYKQGYAEAERIWRAPSSDNEFYQKGLEDAWGAARKISLNCEDGGINSEGLREIFETGNTYAIIQSNTAQEAIDKIKAYEDKHSDRIEVGDEVSAEDGTSIFIVTWMSERCICGVDKEGRCYSYELSEICGKTGKHYDIASILEAMRTHD